MAGSGVSAATVIIRVRHSAPAFADASIAPAEAALLRLLPFARNSAARIHEKRS
jgi:hypothetical protein